MTTTNTTQKSIEKLQAEIRALAANEGHRVAMLLRCGYRPRLPRRWSLDVRPAAQWLTVLDVAQLSAGIVRLEARTNDTTDRI